MRSLDGKAGKLTEEMADGPGLRVRGIADPDLLAGTLRAETMEVLVSAGVDEPARTAGAAGTDPGIDGVTEQPGRKVERKRRLADRSRTDEE
jgi:hypothetical protein